MDVRSLRYISIYSHLRAASRENSYVTLCLRHQETHDMSDRLITFFSELVCRSVFTVVALRKHVSFSKMLHCDSVSSSVHKRK